MERIACIVKNIFMIEEVEKEDTKKLLVCIIDRIMLVFWFGAVVFMSAFGAAKYEITPEQWEFFRVLAIVFLITGAWLLSKEVRKQ